MSVKNIIILILRNKKKYNYIYVLIGKRGGELFIGNFIGLRGRFVMAHQRYQTLWGGMFHLIGSWHTIVNFLNVESPFIII